MPQALTPSQVSKAFNKMLRINFDNIKRGGKRAPLFIWGPPGIGKSMLFEQECKKRNLLLIDVRLTQMEPTDLRGIPVPVAKSIHKAVTDFVEGNEESDVTITETSNVDMVEVRWAIPGFLPQINTQNGKWDGWHNGHKYDGFVILLDELPNAPQSVQAGSYQLVLDGKLGEYIVPSNGVIFAAGNRMSDKGGTYKMPRPLVNRFIHIEMEADFKEWQKYAISAGINAKIIGYLSANPARLTEEFKDGGNYDYGFASPRAWERASDIENDEELYKSETPYDIMRALVGGALGEATAIDYFVHRENIGKLPSPEDILTGKIKNIDNETRNKAAMCYTLVIQLCQFIYTEYRSLNKEKPSYKKDLERLYSYLDRFFDFSMDNFQKEMNVLAGRTINSEYSMDDINLDDVPSFDVFIEKYQDLIADN
ncbi:MAG: MoxR-like ATPase [Caudoviricetes sp.]|nr:MAG: MoxR-like ATPase [Caudoviricetes sp.]